MEGSAKKAFLLGIIYFMNSKALDGSNKQSIQTSDNNTKTYEDNENKTYIFGKAPITGGTVDEQDVKK